MRFFAAGLLVAGLLAASPLLGQPASGASTEEDRVTARRLGEDGLRFYEEGRFAEAYERFEMADRLVPAPTLQLFMARAKRSLGELVAAHALYRKVALMPVASDAPQQFAQAVADAKQELANLDERIPRITIALQPADAQAKVTLDGKAITATEAHLVDPGAHAVEVTRPGQPPLRIDQRVAAGDGTVVVRVPLAATGEPPPPAEPAPEGSLVPAIVAYAVGAAGLGVGIATGVVAKSKIDDVKSRCDGVHCLQSDAALADEASSFATVSTVGFVIGGVGLAAGVVLTIWRPGGGGGEQAWLEVGPSSLAVGGRF
ncbi:MAG: hypothetical protein R3B72_37315 [Polyangiaceae bacterium]